MMLITPGGLTDSFFQDVVHHAEIPFAVIEQVPVYPGCESGTNDEQKKCMAKKISDHVNSNFNVKLANELKLKGKQKIYVQFKIDNQVMAYL